MTTFVKRSKKAGWLLLKDLRKKDDFCWKLYESSTKEGWLSLKAPRKQDVCLWKLYENRMSFVEISTKAGWLWLRAPWKLYKSRMAFVESSTKAGPWWLSLKALQKQDDFHWELYESRTRMTFVESSTKAVWFRWGTLKRPCWSSWLPRAPTSATSLRKYIQTLEACNRPLQSHVLHLS